MRAQPREISEGVLPRPDVGDRIAEERDRLAKQQDAGRASLYVQGPVELMRERHLHGAPTAPAAKQDQTSLTGIRPTRRRVYGFVEPPTKNASHASRGMAETGAGWAANGAARGLSSAAGIWGRRRNLPYGKSRLRRPAASAGCAGAERRGRSKPVWTAHPAAVASTHMSRHAALTGSPCDCTRAERAHGD